MFTDNDHRHTMKRNISDFPGNKHELRLDNHMCFDIAEQTMIISKQDRKTKGNNYIRQKEKASEATTSQVVHFSGGSVKETASTLGNHLSYRLTGRKEMKKNAKSTLLMIIASVVNIVGRCKGRIIIAPEHCLSYQGKRKRCKLCNGSLRSLQIRH